MKKITRTGILIFLFTAFGGIIGYMQRVTLARNLSLADYGLFYAVMSLIYFFSPFRDLGVGESVVYFINKYFAKKEYDKIKGLFKLQIIVQLITSSIIIAIFFILKNIIVKYYFKNPASDFIFSSLLLLFVLDLFFSAMSQIFQAYQEVEISTIANTIKMSIIFASTIILFNFNFEKNIVTPIAYLIGTVIMTGIIATYFAIRFKEILKEKAKITKAMTKEVFEYALPIMFSTAGGVILAYSDTIILTWLRGNEEVGLYNIALPSLNLILLFVTPFLSIIFPKVSNMYHSGKKIELSKFITQIYNNYLIFTLPLALTFLAFPKLIITTLFGEKFLGATGTLIVFSLGFVFMTIRAINFSIIAGIGKAKERSKILYIGAGLNVILDLIMIPLWGAVGAAIATIIGYFVMYILTKRLIRKEYDIKTDKKVILKTIICGGIYILSIAFTKWIININNKILEAIIVVTISFIIYISALIITRIITKEKILIVKKTLF